MAAASSSIRALTGSLALACTLLTASCGPLPGAPVGTWKATRGSDQFEFLKDGTVLLNGMSGQWRKADGGRYLVTFQMYGSVVSFVAKEDGDMLRLQLTSGDYECLARYIATDNGGMMMVSKPPAVPRTGRCT